MSKISLAFDSNAKASSSYKRIQRFLKSYEICYETIAKFLISLIPMKAFYLAFDRTNWKFGKTNINIFMLSIAYKGIAFPIMWLMLDKRGNSNQDERITLLKKFIKIFGKDAIITTLWDREFIGEKFKNFMLSEDIDFRIRLKKDILVANSKGKKVNVYRFFRNLKIGSTRVLKKRKILSFNLYIVGMKLPKLEYLIIVTSKNFETAISDYKKRWEIETMFGCFKKRGFNFEDTHLNNLERIKKLLVLMSLTFCWCHIIGEWLVAIKPIRIKNNNRKERSIFRYGLDHISCALLNSKRKKSILNNCIKILEKRISS